MNITFLGATKTVTGSNFLVEGAGKKFLVDCGMYQGKAKDELENEAPFLYNPEEIDFMLLTHAHIDHSGRIPKAQRRGARSPCRRHRKIQSPTGSRRKATWIRNSPFRISKRRPTPCSPQPTRRTCLRL